MPDAFGIPEVPVEVDPEFPWLNDPALAAEAAVEPQAPAPDETPQGGGTEPPAPVEPTPPAAPAPTEPAATEPTAAETEAAKLWANKYKSPEDLEKGYRELRDLQRRTAERANVGDQRFTVLEQRTQQLEQALRTAVPLIQQAAQSRQATYAQGQSQDFGYEQPQPQPAWTPDQLAPYLDQMVSERVNQARQEMASQADAAETVRAAEAAIRGFYQAHPEVEVRGDIDSDMTSAIQDLNESWARTESALDISDPVSLEIAYEATKRPALLEVLKLHPDYIDTDTGMELARFQASILEGQAITQQTSVVPASQVGQTVGQRKPVIESASSKAPTGSDATLDEFDQAVLEYQKARKSAFAGTPFE